MSKIEPQTNFAFEIARSRFTDAYSSLDKAINERLLGMKAKVRSNHAANVKSLMKAEPGPHLSKTAKANIDETLAELSTIQSIRNSITHGQMTALKFENLDQAVFVNAFQPSQRATNAIMLSQSQFDHLIKTLEKIEKTIRKS